MSLSVNRNMSPSANPAASSLTESPLLNSSMRLMTKRKESNVSTTSKKVGRDVRE